MPVPPVPGADQKSIWHFEHHGRANMSGALEDGIIAMKVFRPGTESWHAQFYASPLAVKAGSYEVRFRVKATVDTTLSVALQQSHEPWKVLGSANVKAVAEWREVSATLKAGDADDNARLTIGGMGTTVGTFEFRDISLRTAGVDGTLERKATKEELEQSIAELRARLEGALPLDGSRTAKKPLGLVPILRKRDLARYTPAKQRDWQEFIWDTETAYWNGLRDFLKKDIGVKAPVVGTQGFWSPGHVQAGMDVIDSHAYWHHPDFHGRGWNADLWSVKNEPMAGAPDGGTLPGLAAQRVAGKPFICTEYNHPAPNTYSAETFPLLCAFAALQDWDGVFAFSYSHRAGDAWSQEHFDNFFDIDRHPVKMATLPAAAISFRRGDVERLTSRCTTHHGLGSIARRTLSRGNVALDEVEKTTELVTRHRVLADFVAGGADMVEMTMNATDDWTTWKPTEGFFSVNGVQSKVWLGKTSNQRIKLGALAFTLMENRQGWACLQYTVVENDNQIGAKRILITATGDIENTGMGWKNAAKTSVGRDWGKAPVLVEGPAAKIEMEPGRDNKKDKFKAWALDERGQRRAEIPVADGVLEIGPRHRTLWYEVERQP